MTARTISDCAQSRLRNRILCYHDGPNNLGLCVIQTRQPAAVAADEEEELGIGDHIAEVGGHISYVLSQLQ